jgi:hypothetical protein
VGSGEVARKRGKRVNKAQKMYLHLCKCKNDTVETIPGMGGMGEIKESGGEGNSSMIYLIHCKKFYKCCSVPPHSTTIKKLKKNNVKANSKMVDINQRMSIITLNVNNLKIQLKSRLKMKTYPFMLPIRNTV